MDKNPPRRILRMSVIGERCSLMGGAGTQAGCGPSETSGRHALFVRVHNHGRHGEFALGVRHIEPIAAGRQKQW